jgi:O-acetyl-ADP-ribose deacetylase (regulator of RNase III)
MQAISAVTSCCTYYRQSIIIHIDSGHLPASEIGRILGKENNYLMIKEVQGDILLTNAELIAHSIAPMDHFENGLALGLREKYPEMAKDFRHYCRVHHPAPGDLFSWSNGDGKQIVNLMAQEAPDSNHSHGIPGKATVRNLDHSLKNLAKLVKKEEIKSLALPKLATGVGGLEWKDVQGLIQKNLGELDIPVYVYTTYVKGKQAHED